MGYHIISVVLTCALGMCVAQLALRDLRRKADLDELKAWIYYYCTLDEYLPVPPTVAKYAKSSGARLFTSEHVEPAADPSLDQQLAANVSALTLADDIEALKAFGVAAFDKTHRGDLDR